MVRLVVVIAMVRIDNATDTWLDQELAGGKFVDARPHKLDLWMIRTPASGALRAILTPMRRRPATHDFLRPTLQVVVGGPAPAMTSRHQCVVPGDRLFPTEP